MELFYAGSFADARSRALEAQRELPEDFLLTGLLSRCEELQNRSDLPGDWAVDVQETK